MTTPEELPPTTPEAPEPTPSEREPPSLVLRRVRRISVVAYVLFAAFSLYTGGFYALIGLTCSGAVVMINFLWLEGIVDSVLQPAPHPKPWRLTLRSLARFGLFGVALSVAIFVARFNASSVLLGFSIVVVGIIGEALYSVYRVIAESR
ncbi:MAG: hypothetical protein QOI24_2091 [Acidobacteriota bacterium]|nr:hypothetical protein [Acidobacteriota bacterium]